jgi:nucleotide-binding universal stress UspA family protein
MSMRLLVVLDESAASRRTVAYLGKMVGRHRDLQLCLAHVLPPLPPGLLESAGDEDPQPGRRQQARLKTRQQRWLLAAKRTAQQTFARAQAALRKVGVPARALDVQFFGALDGRSAADRILALARASRCRTVVVGRESLSWFRELLRGDLAGELVRRADGFTIWVVE